MKTPTGILLGGNHLNQGVFDAFRERGLQVIVVDWNAEPELKGDRHLRIDVKDSRRIVEALKELGDLEVQVAYTSIDVAVPSVVAIHRQYGLHTPAGPHFETPLTKALTTQVWQKAGLLNRFSTLVRPGDVASVQRAAAGRELIVKPNLSSSSRGITILPPGAGAEQVAAALRRAEQTSFDAQAIVEEFVPGREFTVEMLGDQSGNVAVYAISVKYHTAHAGPNRVANKLHYNSAAYPDSTYERIAEYGRRCYQSLDLHCCLGHLEILLRDDGVLSPVEIGARSSGLIVTPLAAIASGRDFFGDYMGVLRGARVEPVFYRSRQSSLYFFYDFVPGRPCRRVTNLAEHLPPGIESLAHDREVIRAGAVYESIDNDAERHGHEILRGSRDVLTIEAITTAENKMLAAMFD